MSLPSNTVAALALALALAAAAAFAACAAASTRRSSPIKPGVTTLDPPLASHRCAAGARACTCRAGGADDKETNPVAAGQVRLELAIYNTLRSEAELRVGTLPWVFRPSGESLRPECWYVDVAPNIYAVDYRIAPADGADVTLGLRVRRYAEVPGERGAPEPRWYEVVDLACGEGHSAECDRSTVSALVDRVHAAPKRHTDPCGNVEVKNLRWDGLLAPMDDSFNELEIQLQLVVMNPPPDKAPCLER